MKKIKEIMTNAYVKVKCEAIALYHDQRGSFGVKEIAITVAVIVVLGFAVTIIDSNMSGWITDIWDLFLEKIEDVIG